MAGILDKVDMRTSILVERDPMGTWEEGNQAKERGSHRAKVLLILLSFTTRAWKDEKGNFCFTRPVGGSCFWIIVRESTFSPHVSVVLVSIQHVQMPTIRSPCL